MFRRLSLHSGMCRGHLIEQPEGKESNPDQASENRDAFEETSQTSSWDKRCYSGVSQEENEDNNTCNHGGSGPTPPGWITGKTPCKDEASRRYTDEKRQAPDEEVERSVQTCMESWSIRSAWRVAKGWISDKDPGEDETHPGNREQNWPPYHTSASSEGSPNPEREAENEQTADDKVCDLHPTLVTQAQRTCCHPPGIVAGAGSTFDQNPQDEEERANCTSYDQEPGDSGGAILLC